MPNSDTQNYIKNTITALSLSFNTKVEYYRTVYVRRIFKEPASFILSLSECQRNQDVIETGSSSFGNSKAEEDSKALASQSRNTAATMLITVEPR